MLHSFFAGIGIFLATIFGGQSIDTVAPARSQPTAAIVALAGNNSAANAGTATESTPSTATTTIVNQYITQPVIERTVQAVAAPTGAYVTENELSQKLAALSDAFARTILGTTYPAPTTSYASGGVWNSIALMGRIENLSGTTLSGITVDGVSGLTASDIPALSYLPLSGGTLTGDVSLTNATSTNFFATTASSTNLFAQTATLGALTANTLVLTTALPVSSGGTGANTFGQGWIYSNGGTSALAASTSPTVNYITATSTTATSTITGPILFGSSPATSTSAMAQLMIDSTNFMRPFSIRSNGSLYAHMVVQGPGGTNGIGIFNKTYLAFENKETNTNPLLSISSDPGTEVSNGGSATIQAYSTADSTYKHRLQIMTSGELWLWPTNGDAVRIVAAPLTPYTDATGSLGDATHRWASGSLGGAAGTVPLTIKAASAQTADLFDWQDSAGTGLGAITASGGFGIGTTTPTGKFEVITSSNVGSNSSVVFKRSSGADSQVDIRMYGYSGTPGVYYANSVSNLVSRMAFMVAGGAQKGSESYTEAMSIDRATAKIGIATTSPWRTLSVTGTVGLDGLTGNFGAGSLCLTANKEVVYNSGSDSCLSSTHATKHDILPLDLSALDMVKSLQPVSFVYNNDASSTIRYGFIAEDTAAVDSHLATYDAQGAISGIDDRSIISVVVKALQQIASRISSFADSFRTDELTFIRASGDELTVKRLCVEDVCVTRDQFLRIVEQSGQAPAPSSPTPSEPDKEQANGAPLSPSDKPAPTDEADEAENIPKVSDAPPLAPEELPEEIPADLPTAVTAEE